MSERIKETTCDLVVIGAGMAGMAAALFAARRRIAALQVGMAAQLGFASGLLDLLGVHPAADTRVLEDPWQGIEQLRLDEPNHPLALLPGATIRKALDIILDFLKNSAYPYMAGPQKNVRILTPAGTIKPTYAVPHTMAYGPHALANKASCLLVDFNRLRGYSARQIALSLSARWPGLRPLSIDFPELQGELYTERMARALDSAGCREALISAIRPHIGNAQAVGLPAVLGIYRTVQVMAEMQQGLGVPVFEIPTMLPAITGLRLQEIFENRLPAMGITVFQQQRVLSARRQSDGRWALDVGREEALQRVVTRSVLLCSGRFLGQGLHAERRGIHETIFDLRARAQQQFPAAARLPGQAGADPGHGWQGGGGGVLREGHGAHRQPRVPDCEPPI